MMHMIHYGNQQQTRVQVFLATSTLPSQLNLNMVCVSHHISGGLWMQFLHHPGANPLSCLQASLRTCQKMGSGSSSQLDLANTAIQIKDFNADESKSMQQFLRGKLCSQEGTQSELSLLKTWKRVRRSTPTHNALWLTLSPAAAHACLFGMEMNCPAIQIWCACESGNFGMGGSFHLAF